MMTKRRNPVGKIAEDPSDSHVNGMGLNKSARIAALPIKRGAAGMGASDDIELFSRRHSAEIDFGHVENLP
jgi:hypothetical protein